MFRTVCHPGRLGNRVVREGVTKVSFVSGRLSWDKPEGGVWKFRSGAKGGRTFPSLHGGIRISKESSSP